MAAWASTAWQSGRMSVARWSVMRVTSWSTGSGAMVGFIGASGEEGMIVSATTILPVFSGGVFIHDNSCLHPSMKLTVKEYIQARITFHVILEGVQ